MKARAFITGFTFLMLFFNGFAQVGNYALMLDGADDYISIPHNNVFNVSKVTIEMWMLWQNTTDPDDVDFLLGKSFEELEIHIGGGSGNHGLRFIPTSQVWLDTEADVFQSGTWYHVAFVYDPSISLYKCYINGIEKTLSNHGPNGVNTDIVHSTEPLRIGIRTGSACPFQGKIDEVRIWNIARTAEAINADMHKELAGNETGLVAYYKMSNGNGTVLADNSGSGNTADLVNGPVWIPGEVALPVELTSFEVNVNDKAVNLSWITAMEVNNYGFEVQRSAEQCQLSNDGWQSIKFIQGQGYSSRPHEYFFTDDNPPAGIIQYRIKQIDNNGSFKFYDAVSVQVDSPMEFRLHQNSPNPFNPSTAIKFQLPVNTIVNIRVYDLMGREVITLLNGERLAGSHIVYWNGCDACGQPVSSGVYLYSLKAGSYTETRKMNLLK